MSIHKSILFAHLAKQKKAELLALLSSAFDAMPESMRSLVFDEVFQEVLVNEWDASRLMAEIRAFRIDSLSRKYYAPFDMNSKNYGHIPEETRVWFDQLGRFIDLCVKLVKPTPNYESLACFEECLNLITLMEDNVEIVFAHEYGSWMIPIRSGYISVYVKAWAQVGTPEQFAEKVAPWVIWDAMQGFGDKAYETVLQEASSAHYLALQERIEQIKLKK